MADKKYSVDDILKIFNKLNKKIEDLQCFVKECCAKIPVNVGTGIGIFKKFNQNKWEFKSLLPGSGINISETNNEVVISASVPTVDCDDIKDCIGINPLGDPNKYLNEQGNWQTISIPPTFITSVSDTSTINLTVTGTDLTADFASMNISQFTNDSGYLNQAAADLLYYPLTNPSNYISLTSLSAGTGISYNNLTGVITNSAPDQTVVLSNGTSINITGSYPNFTITNTAPDQVVSLATTGSGLAVTGSYPSFTLQNTLPDQTVVLTQGGTTTITGSYPNFTISSADQYVGTVTSVATSAPLTGGTITTSGTIGITQATSLTDGYLSSTDWSTFNNKQNALGFTPEDVANKTDLMAGNTTSSTAYLSAKGVYDWVTNEFDPLVKRHYFDDFQGISVAGPTFTGTGSYSGDGNISIIRSGTGATYARTNSEAGHSGIIRGGTGTTNAGLCTIGFRGIWMGTNDWQFEGSLRLQTLSTATERYTIVHQFGTGTTNSIRLFYSDNVNSGKWQAETYASSVSTLVDTGVTVAINTWYNMKIVRISNVITFYINGSLVATISTNVPSSFDTNALMSITKTAGTTTRTCDFDYLKLYDL